MPLNSQIPLAVRIPEVQSPTSTFGDMIRIQGAMQENEARKMALDQQRKVVAEDTAMSTALQKYGGDKQKTVQELLSQGHFATASKVNAELWKERALETDNAIRNFDFAQKKLESASNILRGVEQSADKETAFQVAKSAISGILGPELTAHLGDSYDPNRVKSALEWGMNAGTSIALQRFGAQQAREAITNAQDDDEEKRKSLTEWRNAAAAFFATAEDDQQWQAVRNLIVKQGAPTELMTVFPERWSKDAQDNATRMAIGARDLLTLQDRDVDNARLDRDQDERKRHNLELERAALIRANRPSGSGGTGQGPDRVTERQAKAQRAKDLTAARKALRDGDMTEEEYDEEVAAIEQVYRDNLDLPEEPPKPKMVQGTPGDINLPMSGTRPPSGTPRVGDRVGQPPSQAAAASGPVEYITPRTQADFKVNKAVPLKDGRWIKILKIEGGKIADYVEVPPPPKGGR